MIFKKPSQTTNKEEDSLKTKQSADDALKFNLGGQGGQAPGAGGGGGAAISPDALKDIAGHIDQINLNGEDGKFPGAGGGGGGAVGEFAQGGQGGEGGEMVSATFLAKDIPATVEVVIGRGGRPGQDGGDTSFGNLLIAKGGKAGKSPCKNSDVTDPFSSKIIQVTAAFIANHAEIVDQLVNISGANWDHYNVGNLPAVIKAYFVCFLEVREITGEILANLTFEILDPSGCLSGRCDLPLFIPESAPYKRASMMVQFEASVQVLGIWKAILSYSGKVLAEVPFAIVST